MMTLEQKLESFYGTENYFACPAPFQNVVYTDGIKYLIEKVKCYWLIDTIASYLLTSNSPFRKASENDSRLLSHSFWNLKTNLKKKTAILTCVADEGEKTVVEQKIKYTDFPLENIELWVAPTWLQKPYNNDYYKVWVIYLPSEH